MHARRPSLVLRVLSLVTCGCAGLIAADAAPSPDRDLIAHYRLDGDARDASGNGRHGTVVGAVPTKDRFGDDHGAMRFDGCSAEIVVDPPPPLKADGYSISLWFAADLPEHPMVWQDIGDGAADFHGPLIGQDDGYSIRCFQLWFTKASLVWQRMNEYSSVWTPGDLEARRWYHAVALFDGKRHGLYLDGRPAMERVPGFSKISRDEPLRIGSKGAKDWPKQVFFAGAIDDIRLYNRVLADDEIAALSRDRPER